MPEMLTANFSRDEFTCKDMCGYDDVDMRLVQGLQLLRNKLGRKIHVISGCRCPNHNHKEGGATYSQHLLGMAVDIAVAGIPIREVCKVAMTIPVFKGFGLDEQRCMLHLDVREDPVRWVYLGGKPVYNSWPIGLEPVTVGVPA
jgi:uncharacterized protein YcbK (DUF882 family)